MPTEKTSAFALGFVFAALIQVNQAAAVTCEVNSDDWNGAKTNPQPVIAATCDGTTGYIIASAVPAAARKNGASFITKSMVQVYDEPNNFSDFHVVMDPEKLAEPAPVKCSNPRYFVRPSGLPDVNVLHVEGCDDVVLERIVCDSAKPGGKPELVPIICGTDAGGRYKSAADCLAESQGIPGVAFSPFYVRPGPGKFDCNQIVRPDPNALPLASGGFVRVIPAQYCKGKTKTVCSMFAACKAAPGGPLALGAISCQLNGDQPLCDSANQCESRQNVRESPATLSLLPIGSLATSPGSGVGAGAGKTTTATDQKKGAN